ncbi:hypothetical protein [Limnofasciculus baicalensis]|uniref:Uncharacterized protein n=1 Tax=Limnofasciculus baicalensis BBK-W-15 TaxID=2699891 RepID=A0AAE3KRM9_9CYAN|nr:hypothetical protein [Limnofasciculus baicalensis]MCP2731848.1 hypothetical protein [Limnofasciculus baicalensis BBK-W-15]
MKNFTLSLVAFHLRQTLTDALDEADADANLLWETLAKLGEKQIPFPELAKIRTQLICYQNNQYTPQAEAGGQIFWLTHSGKDLDLGSIPTPEGFKITANLQPFRLHDTYAADLTLAPDNPNIDITIPQIQHFKPNYLLPSHIQASIGTTLWLYGEIDSTIDSQDWAEKCAIALVAGSNLNPILVNQESLFDSILFTFKTNNPICQILILLNNSQADTITPLGETYDSILNLLCCHHKISKIYQDSRQSYTQTRQLYSQLEKKIQGYPNLIADTTEKLANLKKLLSQIPEDGINYTRYLRDITAHYTAIDTNTRNYRICLANIKAKGNIPKFWETLNDITFHQWQNQIKIDIDYLTPGENLFARTIETIRGTVEIEQVECDRATEANTQDRQEKLEILIAFIGTALAVSGVSSQVATNPSQIIYTQLCQKESPKNVKLLPYLGLSIIDLLIHIFLGIMIAIPVGIWLKHRK